MEREQTLERKDVKADAKAVLDAILRDLTAFGSQLGLEILVTELGTSKAVARTRGFELMVKVGERLMKRSDECYATLLFYDPKVQIQFQERLRQKLGTPLLDLAFDFSGLKICDVRVRDVNDQNADEIAEPTANIHTENGLLSFPRKELAEKHPDANLYFVKMVAETLREFWEEVGKEAVEKQLASNVAKTTTRTRKAVGKAAGLGYPIG